MSISDDEIKMMRILGVSEFGADALLDEVERLRAENTEAHQHLRNLIDECEQRRDKITFAEAKLAKAVAALEAIERFQPNPNNPMDPYKQIAIASKGIARQTLKEIGE